MGQMRFFSSGFPSIFSNSPIVRIYKTDNGWETSTSFGRDELPLVAKVADMAHLWIYQNAEQEKATPEPPSEPRSQTSRRSRERAAANS